jgi:citrate lyase subunit beta / citryl-CoA lyase
MSIGNNLRSCLILPDDPLRSAQALFLCDAEALVLDLRAAGDPSWRDALAFLQLARGVERRPQIHVRLSAQEDLDPALRRLSQAPPDGVFFDGAGGAGVQRLGARLAVFEAEAGLEDGATAIVAIAAQTAAAVFLLGGYADCSPRLKALAFDSQALAGSLALDPAAAPVATARSLTILAAAAANVPAIAIVEDCGSACLAAARKDGFAGAATRRAEDIALINATFGQVSCANRVDKTPQSGS